MKIQRDLKKVEKGFTLIELLVVMTIILILAGAMTPAALKVLAKAKEKNAEQTALELVNSISTYQSEYRRNPVESKQQSGADVQLESDEGLMNILLGQEGNRNNPSGQSFFNGKNAKGNPPVNGVVFNPDGGGRLYDPWGNLYRVMLDTDNNKRVVPPFKKLGMAGANMVGKSVIVWSLGPDGIEGGEGAKDNIVTW